MVSVGQCKSNDKLVGYFANKMNANNFAHEIIIYYLELIIVFQ